MFQRSKRKALRNGEYYKLRGNCHWKMGNLKEAINDYKEMIQINNDPSPSVIMDFSDLLFESGKFDEAEIAIKKIGADELTANEAVRLESILKKIKQMEKMPMEMMAVELEDDDPLMMYVQRIRKNRAQRTSLLPSALVAADVDIPVKTNSSEKERESSDSGTFHADPAGKTGRMKRKKGSDQLRKLARTNIAKAEAQKKKMDLEGASRLTFSLREKKGKSASLLPSALVAADIDVPVEKNSPEKERESSDTGTFHAEPATLTGGIKRKEGSDQLRKLARTNIAEAEAQKNKIDQEEASRLTSSIREKMGKSTSSQPSSPSSLVAADMDVPVETNSPEEEREPSDRGTLHAKPSQTTGGMKRKEGSDQLRKLARTNIAEAEAQKKKIDQEKTSRLTPSTQGIEKSSEEPSALLEFANAVLREYAKETEDVGQMLKCTTTAQEFTRKRKAPSTSDASAQISKKLVFHSPDLSESQIHLDRNPDDSNFIAQTWADALENTTDPRQRALARKVINDVILKAQRGILNEKYQYDSSTGR